LTRGAIENPPFGCDVFQVFCVHTMKEIININLQTFKINSVLDSTLPHLKLQFPDSQAPRYSRVTAHRLELQAQGSGSIVQIQRDRVKDLKQYPLIVVSTNLLPCSSYQA
jgi:hypothetical protein